MKLLERDDLLAQLHEQLHRAVSGPGLLAFVEGEAGIGKTSLLRAFAETQHTVPVRWGGCDALQTPRPLGPLYDITPSGDRFLFLREGGPDGHRTRRGDLRLVRNFLSLTPNARGR